ncbi:TPA: hypothetical protein ACGCBC_000819 [Pseudomonas aeruginosa]
MREENFLDFKKGDGTPSGNPVSISIGSQEKFSTLGQAAGQQGERPPATSLLKQCATRLRGIVEALDNIHDNTPHRWSTDLDDVHSSAESLLALIKDQAPTQAAQGLAGAALAQPSPAQTQPSPAPTLRAAIDVANDRFEVPVAKWGTDLVGEEERPEVVAYFDRNYPSTGDAFIWSNYEGSPYEPVMTVAQHDRIVGALRAENAKLIEALDECDGDRWKLRSERDAALARVAKLEHSQSFQRDIDYSVLSEYAYKHRLHFNNLCAVVRSALIALPAQAQHSVPEGWMLVPVEPLLNMMSDKDHDTRITAERQLLSILADAPGKEVGHE